MLDTLFETGELIPHWAWHAVCRGEKKTKEAVKEHIQPDWSKVIVLDPPMLIMVDVPIVDQHETGAG